MPLTNKYQPMTHRDDPLFGDEQLEILKLQDKIFEAVFGPPRHDASVPFNVHESKNPPGVNPWFNPRYLKTRARGFQGDPRVHFYTEVPNGWDGLIWRSPEVPFKDIKYGDTGEFGIKKKYRNFVVRASFEKVIDPQDEYAISRFASIMTEKDRHGEHLKTETMVPGLRLEHMIETERGQRRKVYVSVVAVKPRVVPLSDVVEEIARYPSLVEDLVNQMLNLRADFRRYRLKGGRNFEEPWDRIPSQPEEGFQDWSVADCIGTEHPALPSGDLSRCKIRLPAGGVPKDTLGDYYTLKRVVHILAEVAPDSLNRNVIVADTTAFRIFVGDNFPASDFYPWEIRRLAKTFGLVYNFHNFGQLLVREGKRRDKISGQRCWDLKHLHGWTDARFEPAGIDVVRWDTQFPLHLPGYPVFYECFRKNAELVSFKEQACPYLPNIIVRYAQTMFDFWTKAYKDLYRDEYESRKAWLKKMQAAGWTYKGVEKGWEKKKRMGGSLRRAFRR